MLETQHPPAQEGAAPRAGARRNLILVGLMGAGKTTIGRLLARHFERSFVDCDHEIEARCGVRIPVIFEHEGEEGFRARESQMLAELVMRDNIVLATGGGAVLAPANRLLLRDHGFVVYLRAQPHDLFHRTQQDRNRPLLRTDDPEQRLRDLYAFRDPLYQETAHMMVETGRQSPAMLAGKLEQQLRETWTNYV